MKIHLSGVNKSFGDFVALRDIELTIDDGELVALLGPSGSGKTTLLRLIAGLERPDPIPGCRIEFDGVDVTHTSVRERRVGFVFQHYALFRHMTVFDNIAFGLRVRPRRLRPSKQEIAAKVNELLDLVQLKGLAHRYPNQLSGGQRQRVALARALAVEPNVLLLDEPFGALDAKVRQDLRRWLRRLHDEIHITSVFVTHDQEEALEVADRVVVMNKGAIEQIGTPDEVFHQPASEFVMRFLGNVNIFHGRIRSGKAFFGEFILDPIGRNGFPSGERDARLLVRPENVELYRDDPGYPAFRARVQRIQLAGPYVKIELLTPVGESLHAFLPHARFQEMRFIENEPVYVTFRDPKVFVDGQAPLAGVHAERAQGEPEASEAPYSHAGV